MIILYSIFTIINNYMILFIHQNIFKTKLSKTQYVTCYLLLSLMFIFINNILIINFIIILYLSLILLKLNISKAMISSIIFLSIYLIAKFISNTLNIPNYFCLYLYSTILLIASLIISKINFNLHIETYPFLYTFLNTLIIIYLLTNILFLSSSTSFNLVNIFIILVLNILSIYILYLINLNYKNSNEIKNLTLICDSTRAFKHDFNNIMHAIGGYIQTNNLNDLKLYYDKLIPECFCINNLYRFHSKLMQNSALYSIISNKYNIAEKNNIKMTLNISSDLNNLRIDDYSLTRILGILLDNSIEASKECHKKLINISFEENKSKQSIIIENTFLNKNISIKKIYEKNFTTKKNNSGLGLWEVKKILNNHENINLTTNIDNEFFVQKNVSVSL